MNIFINDIFIGLQKPEEQINEEDFNSVVDCSQTKLTRAHLIHHVLLKNACLDDLDVLIELIENRLPRNLFSVVVQTLDYEEAKSHFKSKYKVIKAAGGVVKKGKSVYMIRRLGKWDLPKGKINKYEEVKEAAVREVEEECGLQVKIKQKLCNTWHTYTLKKRPILKKTTWYIMNVIEDKFMKPQTEESIEEIKLMTPKEVYHALESSYRSIRFVMEKYYQQK